MDCKDSAMGKKVKINNELMHLTHVSSFLFLKNSHWTLANAGQHLHQQRLPSAEKSKLSVWKYLYRNTHLIFNNVPIVLLNTLSKPEGGAPSEVWWGSCRRARQEADASGGTAAWKLVPPPVPLFGSSCHQGAAPVRWQGCPQTTQPQEEAERFPSPTSHRLLAPHTSPIFEGAGRQTRLGPPTSLLSGLRIDVLHPDQSNCTSWILGSSSTKNRGLSGISAAKLVALAT